MLFHPSLYVFLSSPPSCLPVLASHLTVWSGAVGVSGEDSGNESAGDGVFGQSEWWEGHAEHWRVVVLVEDSHEHRACGLVKGRMGGWQGRINKGME